MDAKSEISLPNMDTKPVETLVINNNVNLKNNNKTGKVNHPVRKEDEKITSAVMKVLEGYDWTLVPAATK